jgi:hypothetical protein
MKKITLLATLGLILIASSCVKDELYKSAPVIKSLTITPQIPAPGQEASISAVIFDADGQVTAKLYYKAGNSQLTFIELTASNDTLYTGSIPGQADGITVSYYLEAKSKSGKKSFAPSGAPSTMAAYTIGAPLVLMNEIYSRGTANNPDWIEIYNASDAPVNLSGFKVYDIGAQTAGKPKKIIPEGTVVPARGFFVIVTEGTGDPSDFGLSSAGETVWFENPQGNVLDEVAFPAMDVNQSYGRSPDGGPNWQLLNTITPGAPNSNLMPTVDLVLNEIFSQGNAQDPDWIEIYNKSNFEADLQGWKIYDNGGQGGTKPKMTFPSGAKIPAKGFFVIVVDDGSAAGFGLSSSGEQVWLEKPNGTIADQITFPSLTSTQSFGRFPDGSDNWQVLNSVTRGAANSNANPVAIKIVINEIYSRGTVTEPDWIELFNDGETSVDLSGWLIYDNGGEAGTKPKKAIPSGTNLASKAFFVIATEGTGDPSDFGLSSSGEKVWLARPDLSIADSVTFPALEESRSFGRFPDGTANWAVLFTVTKGAANIGNTPTIRIVMNEIYSRGTTTEPDWIEIYNDSPVTVNLTGWKIYDNGGQTGTKPKKIIPEGTNIAPNGFFVINTEGSGDPSDFGLSSAGETVWLEKPDGVVADQVAFPAMEITQSYGRKPDGSANWQLLNTITKGTSNNNAK